MSDRWCTRIAEESNEGPVGGVDANATIPSCRPCFRRLFSTHFPKSAWCCDGDTTVLFSRSGKGCRGRPLFFASGVVSLNRPCTGGGIKRKHISPSCFWWMSTRIIFDCIFQFLRFTRTSSGKIIQPQRQLMFFGLCTQDDLVTLRKHAG